MPNLIEEIATRATPTKMAEACGVSLRALKFWRNDGELPKTEWTGETNYCQAIADLMADGVAPVTRAQILANQTHQLVEGVVYKLPVSLLRRDPHQPRRQFDPEDLQELADALKVDGQETPITFRVSTDEGAPLVLVHGERRWRASQAGDMDTINGVLDTREEAAPGERIFRQVADNTGKPLSSWDWSCTIAHLHDSVGLTDKEISNELTRRGLKGFSRPAVANLRRLQKLPADAQTLIAEAWLSPAHGKYLLAIKDSKTQAAVIKQLVGIKQSGEETPTIEDMNQKAANFCRREYKSLFGYNAEIGGWLRIDIEVECKGCPDRVDIAGEHFCKSSELKMRNDTFCTCLEMKHKEGEAAQKASIEEQKELDRKREKEVEEAIHKQETDPSYQVEDADLQAAIEDEKEEREENKRREKKEQAWGEYKNMIKDAILNGDLAVALSVALVEMIDIHLDETETTFKSVLDRMRVDHETIVRKLAVEEIDSYSIYAFDHLKEIGIALEINPPEGLEDA